MSTPGTNPSRPGRPFGPQAYAGAHTALVTPFLNGQVAWADLRKLVDFQIKEGIDGLISVGTTGESPTLDYDEHIEVIRKTVEFAAGRVPVMAGTGSNATTEALDLTKRADEVGAQGIISVASNWLPGPVAQLAALVRQKKFAEAKALHAKLADIFKTLFVEPNPVPVKHVMQRAGLIQSGEVRLPLCEMTDANRRLVEACADATLANLR